MQVCNMQYSEDRNDSHLEEQKGVLGRPLLREQGSPLGQEEAQGRVKCLNTGREGGGREGGREGGGREGGNYMHMPCTIKL